MDEARYDELIAKRTAKRALTTRRTSSASSSPRRRRALQGHGPDAAEADEEAAIGPPQAGTARRSRRGLEYQEDVITSEVEAVWQRRLARR
jgi:hypothetical protein